MMRSSVTGVGQGNRREMMPKIPSQEWIDVHLSEGREGILKFTLVWSGKLPSSGNARKTADVTRIRSELHSQIAYLWETHNALQVLKEYGFIVNPRSGNTGIDQSATPRQIYQRFPNHLINLCEWLPVGGKQTLKYMPLVRKSLNLTCGLKILFLRQEDPGSLITQGGDLDGRMKTLLDALRMPSEQEQDAAPPTLNEIYCLMESDSLVSSIDVETERLLFPTSTHQHDVHLVIEVSLRVLRVHQGNYCLL